MINDIIIFNAEEAANVALKLEDLREKWLTRGAGFYTFGIATYLDIINSYTPEKNYYERVCCSNALLMQVFGQEFEFLRNILSHHLKASVRYEETIAMPGFHIFENSGVCTTDLPSYHFDLQYRYLRWPFEPVSDEVISFTLAIKLPKLGGGLDVWQVDESEILRLERIGRRVTLEQLARSKPVYRHEYQVGRMVIQLKTLMHRISAISERYPGDQRITWQGHGVKHKNEWILYW